MQDVTPEELEKEFYKNEYIKSYLFPEIQKAKNREQLIETLTHIEAAVSELKGFYLKGII